MNLGPSPQRLAKFYSIFQLWLSAVLLEWRSRHGFMTLVSLFRAIAIIAILLRFLIAKPVEVGPLAWGILVAYLAISILSILVVLFLPHYGKIKHVAVYLTTILIDLAAVCYFLYLSGDVNSDMYLLLLLPLVVTAHYLARYQGLIMSLFIAASYLLTLGLIPEPNVGNTAHILLTWGIRSAFLLSATWIYRVQGNFPRIHETRIVSPSRARAKLEDMLREFKLSVPYDSISVQLLYRRRLQIIACDGFKNPKEIYQIEFPVEDKRYPNRLVIGGQRPVTVNPEEYPSFSEAQYFARHVKTWLGVPLISPATGECFGMISIDSSRPNAYNRRDLLRASWLAKRVSSFLIEASLGPAAMSMITRRENTLNLLKVWSDLIPTNTSEWEDDQQASREIVSIGKKIFNVEDCSVYFLRHKIDSRGRQERVLHLIASSTIPEHTFRSYESKVTGREGDGLTGLAVHRLNTLNYGASQIQRSPYRGTYVGHLDYLFSRRSRQILVVPLLDSKGNPTGAIKLENRLGWGSDSPFSLVEQNMFEVFAAMVSLMLENIRQRNFINRISQSVHNLRAILHPAAIQPIDEILAGQETPGDGIYGVNGRALREVHSTINYTKIVLDGILAESADHLILENQGLIPAVHHYMSTLKSMPQFSESCERISLDTHNHLRDDLPFQMRVAFYNIAREAVLNMVRHANLDKRPGGYGSLTFSQTGADFHMTIQDNGTGIPPEKQRNSPHHFGLRDMEFQFETIRHLSKNNSGMKIESQPDQGTRIHVWVSLKS